MAAEDERHLRERLNKLRGLPLLRGTRLSGDTKRLEKQLDRIEAEPSDEEIWRSVELARHSQRPYTLDYVERLFEDFVELHGDRARAEDPALVTGLARFGGRTVALIGQQKGRDINERTKRNFGMAHPEGYRKGMRLMEIAQRHGFPLVTFLDSPGAYPGVAAEQVKAAVALKPDAVHCLELGVIDEIVDEPQGGAHLNPDEAARMLGEALGLTLDELSAVPGAELREQRRERYRRIGIYITRAAETALRSGS